MNYLLKFTLTFIIILNFDNIKALSYSLPSTHYECMVASTNGCNYFFNECCSYRKFTKNFPVKEYDGIRNELCDFFASSNPRNNLGKGSNILFGMNPFFVGNCLNSEKFDSYFSQKKSFDSNKNYGINVSVCRFCALVVTWEDWQKPGSNYWELFPNNMRIKSSCNQWEGHMWYNAGTTGPNKFKCTVCGAVVSIRQTKPRCLTFCEQACGNKSTHNWVKLN